MDIRIITVSFLEDDAIEIGDIPMDDTLISTVTVDTVDEAVYLIQAHGLTFSATGNDWAGDPDGSQIVDYGTARREMVSAHFGDNVTDDDAVAIMDAVG